MKLKGVSEYLLYCFKSHRDKVQIPEKLSVGGDLDCFKSHRDKVQINIYSTPLVVYCVSNPIGTKFKFFILWGGVRFYSFQIP